MTSFKAENNKLRIGSTNKFLDIKNTKFISELSESVEIFLGGRDITKDDLLCIEVLPLCFIRGNLLFNNIPDGDYEVCLIDKTKDELEIIYQRICKEPYPIITKIIFLS